MNFTWKDFVRFSFLLAVGGIISMLPFSKIVISISEFTLAGAWICTWLDEESLVRQLRKYSWPVAVLYFLPLGIVYLFHGIYGGFRALFRNKPAFVFFSLFLLHIAGLLFTSDFDYAWKDLRTKLPIFLLPLFLGTTSQINKRWFHGFLILYLLALVVATLMYSWRIAHFRYIDIRDVSRNVSHIIFGLELAFALFILAWFIFRDEFPIWIRTILMLTAVWFMVYILISRSFTGLAVFAITALIVLPILVFRQKRPGLKILLASLMVVVTSLSVIYLYSVIRDFYRASPVDLSKLETHTSRGNPYIHNTSSKLTENGNYLYLYVQWDELRAGWNKRSRISFDGTDLSGQKIVYTLVRFLTSKNLRKDADGVAALSDREIHAIERGVPNYLFLKRFSIRSRIYELLWGWEMYKMTGNPTGYTLIQRFEFWKASLGIIRDNWLTGVGTGDMNEAFRDQYIKMNSKLAPDQRWRSHNQFLSIFVGFGILGFLWFLFTVLYPPLKLKAFPDYFFLVFFIISLLSMMTEDTLESQMGVTLIAFFYGFLLYFRKEYEQI